jgi:hypothetical protein
MRALLILSLVVATCIFIFESCDLNTPTEVDRSNPWDADNPNRPRTPEGLVGSAISATEIQITWRDFSGNEDGFDVFEQAEGDDEFYVVASTQADVEGLQLADKTPNTEYVYWVRAFNHYGSSDSSNLARVTTPGIPPEVPGNLTARNERETDIILTWQDRSINETAFQIFESVSDTLNFEQISIVDQDDTTFTVVGQEAYITYYYQIRAINDFGESEFSPTAWSTPAANPPTAPSSLIATPISGTEIILSWQDNSTSESGFELYQREENDQNFHLIRTTSTNATIDTLAGKQISTTYFYRIRAINQFGQSGYSQTVSATTEEDPLLPKAPTNLRAAAVSANEIVLYWQDRNDNDGEIELFQSIHDDQDFNAIDTIDAAFSTYSIDALEANTSYYYRFRAVNEFGYSPFSDIVGATTLIGNPFSSPSDPVPSDEAGEQPIDVQLRWECENFPEDSLVYDVYFGASQNPPHIGYNLTEKELNPGSLEHGQMYFWRIMVHDEHGQSTTGPLWSFNTVEMEELPIPDSLQFEILEDSTSIRLSWEYENDRDFFDCWEENRLIYTTRSTEVIIDNLERGTPYLYRVRAAYGGVLSEFSEVCEVEIPQLPEPEWEIVYETNFDERNGDWTGEGELSNEVYHSPESSIEIADDEGFQGNIYYPFEEEINMDDVAIAVDYWVNVNFDGRYEVYCDLLGRNERTGANIEISFKEHDNHMLRYNGNEIIEFPRGWVNVRMEVFQLNAQRGEMSIIIFLNGEQIINRICSGYWSWRFYNFHLSTNNGDREVSRGNYLDDFKIETLEYYSELAN